MSKFQLLQINHLIPKYQTLLKIDNRRALSDAETFINVPETQWVDNDPNSPMVQPA